MTWETFYLICFLVGFLLSLLSFIAQSGHLHAGHGHFTFHGHGAHGHAASGHGSGLMSKFNFATIAAFLAWFGGSGYLIERHTGLWALVGLCAAALIGIAGASVVFWFLSKLVARDRTLNPADYDMIGVLGHVTSTVREGGIGEMNFPRDGGRVSAPARSEDGKPIGKGTEVVITRYEKGVAYVKKWDELAG
jgi:membrane protein implicated in regulation of membrane protease activity